MTQHRLRFTRMVTPPYSWFAEIEDYFGRGDSQEEAVLHLWFFLKNHHPEAFELYCGAFPPAMWSD